MAWLKAPMPTPQVRASHGKVAVRPVSTSHATPARHSSVCTTALPLRKRMCSAAEPIASTNPAHRVAGQPPRPVSHQLRAVNATTPRMLWVPLRCPPLSVPTTTATALLSGPRLWATVA